MYNVFDWANKPENVYACSTLTAGGMSTGDYAEFNLASHVGDDFSAVTANRKKLITDLGLPAEPVWLEQVHSNKVIVADDIDMPPLEDGCTQEYRRTQENRRSRLIPQADASISRNNNTVCVVLTADCLPVFFCNQSGTEVAVAHAGWRGLHAGIISRTIKKMHSSVEELLVNFGPAIGAQAFEVGIEVKQAFAKIDRCYHPAFKAVSNVASIKEKKDRYLCDIYQLARIELQLLGVDPARITGGEYCTFTEPTRFYSYRRHKQTGRMANLIWLA